MPETSNQAFKRMSVQHDWQGEPEPPMTNLGTINSAFFDWSAIEECEKEEHPLKHEKRGNCLERVTCEICGYYYEIDSSD